MPSALSMAIWCVQMFVHIYELGVYFVGLNLNESGEIPALEKRPVPYTDEKIFGDIPPPLIHIHHSSKRERKLQRVNLYTQKRLEVRLRAPQPGNAKYCQTALIICNKSLLIVLM